MKMKSLIVGALLGVVLSGCTALGNLTTPAASPLVQVAVDLAVGTAVSRSPMNAQLATQNIYNIAKEALTIDTGSSVAITAIEAAVNARIAQLNLPPPDLQAAQILSATITQLITAKLSSGGGTTTTSAGTVTSTTQVAVATVLQDVMFACQTYGAK